MKMWLIIAVTQLLRAVVKLKPEKNSDLDRIQTHDLCNNGTVLYQLSYQANRELVMLWVCNIPIDGEEYITIIPWARVGYEVIE